MSRRRSLICYADPCWSTNEKAGVSAGFSLCHRCRRALMIVATRAMRVTVCHFFFASVAHIHHFHIE